ncbi:MAG: DUF4384 domain-containing protein [Elusimicrobiales bacterium]|nr:DUF4384 domain-containing protein [Elusimicrobiales bacterium]
MFFCGTVCAKTVEFVETGTGSSSKYERLLDAQNRAEQDALSKALAKNGVDVFYGYHDLAAQGGAASQFIASVLSVFSSGVAQYERSAGPECVLGRDGDASCTVTLAGKITFRGEPDAGFEISLDGLRPEYCEGDAVSVSLKATRDSWLNIISVDEGKNAALIFPYAGARFDKLKAGETFQFPPKDEAALEAVLPEGAAESFELFQIIMTKKEPLFEAAAAPGAAAGPGDFMAVSKRLAGLERSAWAMRLLPYRIVKCANKKTESKKQP